MAITADNLNLDGCTETELSEFWKEWHRTTKTKAFAFLGIPDSKRVMETLAAYALAKKCAMELRKGGDIQSATVYERHCDIYYNRLPESVRR